MKKYCLAFIVFAIMTAGCSLLAFAEEKVSHSNAVKLLDDASFKKMAELSYPGNMQDRLSSLRGEWNYSITFWTTPDAEPQKSTGTSVNEMILGDRFISMKSSGILNLSGNFIPFETNGLMGYDNLKKVFTSVWVDTLNPGMMVGSGALSEKQNAIQETGNFTSALEGAAHNYRSEFQFIDPDNYKRLIFLKDKSGKEYKLMEFLYNKKK